MAFIRVQNLKRDGDGRVRSGSASVIDVAYDPDAKSGHSRQKVRESLGRVLWLSEDRRSGVFLSKTRGLVAYDAGEPCQYNGQRNRRFLCCQHGFRIGLEGILEAVEELLHGLCRHAVPDGFVRTEAVVV